MDEGYDQYDWPPNFYPGNIPMCTLPLPADGRGGETVLWPRYVVSLHTIHCDTDHPFKSQSLNSFGIAQKCRSVNHAEVEEAERIRSLLPQVQPALQREQQSPRHLQVRRQPFHSNLRHVLPKLQFADQILNALMGAAHSMGIVELLRRIAVLVVRMVVAGTIRRLLRHHHPVQHHPRTIHHRAYRTLPSMKIVV
jgi:hypothetical protein